MRRLLKREWILLGFAALAAAQAMVLTWSYGGGPPLDNRWFTTGDTLDFLHAPYSPDTPPLSGLDTPTVLLVFNSECGHCTDVASLWRDWLQAQRGDAQAVAVSREAQEVAEAFADKNGWSAPTWTVDASESGTPNHTLTTRTPWVFVLDSEGVVLAEGNGRNIIEITAILKSEQRSSP